MQELQTEEQFHALTKSQGRVIIEFYADWCPDCRRIEPHFPAWEEKYKDIFTMARANRDDMPDIAEKLEILGIPTFLVFDNGKEVNRLYSGDAKSKGQVESFLDSAYSPTAE